MMYVDISYILAGFDIRIPPTVDLVAFEAQIKAWCEEAGEEVTYEFIQVRHVPITWSQIAPRVGI